MWRPPLCRACASLTFASLGLELGEVLPGGQPHLHLVPVEHLARQELQELVHRVFRGNHHLCVPVGKPRGWAERTLVARIPSSLSRAVWESLLYHPQAGKASSAPSAQWMLGAGGGPGSSAPALTLWTGRWLGSLRTSAPPRRRRRRSGWFGSAAGQLSTEGRREMLGSPLGVPSANPGAGHFGYRHPQSPRMGFTINLQPGTGSGHSFQRSG